MSAQPKPITLGSPPALDHAEHYFCACDPDRAVCGANLKGWGFAGSDVSGTECALCLVLIRANSDVCVRCGR